MLQAVTDVDALCINRDRRDRHSRELETVPGERETWIFHPDLLPIRTKNTEGQSKTAAETCGDDDLRGRTRDPARQRKVRCDLAPQFQLATRVRVQGRPAHF